jgi:glycosyltransferase involved in cell wall biosynthesis
MIAALRSAGVEIQECHVPLWHSIEDRVDAVSGGWKKPSFFLRVIKVYLNLIWKLFFKTEPFDIMIAGYPGFIDVLVAKPYCTILRKKLIWDVLMSVYQVSRERNLIEGKKKNNHFLRRFERHAANLADLLIMDTPEHVEFFSDLHKIPVEKFEVIRLGADETLFFPRQSNVSQDKFTVLYYGGFLRNHGIPFIIEAAKLLEKSNIEFQMIGTGPELEDAKKLTNQYGLENMDYLGFLDFGSLIQKISAADICLGIFGKSIQAEVSINNKIYECMAMGKAIITGNSLATKGLVTKNTIWACSRDDPKHLSEAILKLQSEGELRHQLGVNARNYFKTQCSTKELGISFLNILQNQIGTKGATAK